MTSSIIWILIASLLGFTIAAVFAGWLKLKRNVYLLFYIPLVATLLIAFVIANDLNIKEIILHNWAWGLLGAVIVGTFVVKNVLSQPSSVRQKGVALLSDILWSGFAYGLIDAMLLSVLPILAVKLAITNTTLLDSWSGKILFIVLGLIASFFATTVYHLGYPEFRNKKVIWANIGNGLLSLAYLLTLNPLAAILPHVAMHIVAMMHGPKTTIQVPPHYDD
jgi:MFS family permease